MTLKPLEDQHSIRAPPCFGPLPAPVSPTLPPAGQVVHGRPPTVDAMSLTSRITLAGPQTDDPEDLFASALGVVFPDDVTNQHGDPDNAVVYTSPHLPRPLHLRLCDPVSDTDRRLFSHHLWNSSLLLAELMERGAESVGGLGGDVAFDVKGQSCIELGAGTGLPSIMAGYLGAEAVTVTDYPSDVVLPVLRANMGSNLLALGEATPSVIPADQVQVQGHEWGNLDDPFSRASKHAYTRIIASDCLWMPWQHQNLHRSIAHFLSGDAEARAWVVAGFHTGREKMRGFFAEEKLAVEGLQIDKIWERDCNGEDRPWSWDREDDVTVRKRWLVIGVLKRRKEE